MKNEKKLLRTKADKLWTQIILSKNPLCECCSKKSIQAHHFYPKGLYNHIRYDIYNGIGLCMGCHFSHHHKGDPAINEQIIAKRGKKWYNRLKKKSRERPAGSYLTIEYYQDIIKKLKNSNGLS